jgi:uncharacterized protein involved in exopolysaccharide biosynthesis/Mrp family chromosome partitioning ATPase
MKQFMPLIATTGDDRSAVPDQSVMVTPIGLTTLLAIIRQNMLWIGLSALAAVLLGGAVLYFIQPHFQSEVALVVTTQRPSMPGETNGQGPNSAGLTDQALSSKMDEIVAAPVVRTVIRDLHLDADPEFNKSIPADHLSHWPLVDEIKNVLAPVTREISAYFHPTSIDRTDVADLEVLDNVMRAISVSLKTGSHTIIISATTTDPDKSAAIANALASSYLKYRLDTQKDQTARLEQWLGDRLTELRRDVTRHENEVERLRANMGQYQGQTSTILSEQLSQISRELLDTKAQLADSEAKRAQLKALTGATDSSAADDVLNSLLIQNLRQQEAHLLVQRAAAQSQYGKRNPFLVSLNQQVAEVRQKIATEIGRIDQKVSEQIRVLGGKAAALASAQQELQTQIETQNAALVHLRAVQNDADSDRATYQAFAIFRAKMAGTPTIEQTDVQVISPASPALWPISPKRKTILAVIGLGTLVLGMAASVLRAALAHDLRSAEQASALLGLPTLALIPKVRGSKPIDGVIVDQPASALAEAVRYLYTAVEKASTQRQGSALRVLISSALPDEGKTTTSRMLAQEAALSGVRTLLLNLDLRRHGGTKETEDAFDVKIETEEATGLSVMNVRSRTRRMFAVLHQPAFWQQIQELSTRYDLMIIDSPPVLSVSDATTIASFADFTIFVVKWGKTRLPAVIEALRQLRSVNCNIRGLVLTQVDVRKHAMYNFGDSGVYTGRHKRYYIEGSAR